MATITQPSEAAPAGTDTRFFGHPRGLSTLFFTEMWERFSYYGMRALLILFMTAPASRTAAWASTRPRPAPIYGLYTSLVYLTTLPGGWIADRFLGQRRAVLVRRHHHRAAATSAWPFPSLADLLPGPRPDRRSAPAC